LGKKRASGQALNATYVPKSVKPAQRALEFPGEHVVESAGSLFCRACRECLCVKRSVVKNAFPSNPSLQSQWAAYGISCVQPGIDYFHKRLADDQSNPMKAFKTARFLSPFKMNEIQPMAMDIDDLRAFPFLVGDIRDNAASIRAIWGCGTLSAGEFRFESCYPKQAVGHPAQSTVTNYP